MFWNSPKHPIRSTLVKHRVQVYMLFLGLCGEHTTRERVHQHQVNKRVNRLAADRIIDHYLGTNEQESPADWASRYLHMRSITSRPFAPFWMKDSAHRCSTFSVMEASADNGLIQMRVWCLQIVHPLGLSGWGSYLMFSSTSIIFRRLMFRVVNWNDCDRASTTVDSTQWHISWPTMLLRNHGPGHWMVIARVLYSFPDGRSSLRFSVSTSTIWYMSLFSGSPNLRQNALVTRSHGCLYVYSCVNALTITPLLLHLHKPAAISYTDSSFIPDANTKIKCTRNP